MKNKFACEVLYHLARISDSRLFFPLHGAVRRLYIYILFPTLKYCFKGRLILRHSVQGGKHFNIFVSDLDTSLHLNELDASSLSAAKKGHRRLKKILPMLGELEIYSRQEAKALSKLLFHYEEIYWFFRKVRKIAWMKEARDKELSKYHVYKAERALQIVLADLVPEMEKPNSANLSKCVEDFLLRIVGSANLNLAFSACTRSIYSPYLYQEISLVPLNQDSEATLSLEPASAFMLLAILPGYPDGHQDLLEIIDGLRKIPRVREIYRALSEIERLVFTAVCRNYSDLTEGDCAWLRELGKDNAPESTLTLPASVT